MREVLHSGRTLADLHVLDQARKQESPVSMLAHELLAKGLKTLR